MDIFDRGESKVYTFWMSCVASHWECCVFEWLCGVLYGICVCHNHNRLDGYVCSPPLLRCGMDNIEHTDPSIKFRVLWMRIVHRTYR